jgi:hypothetical protein
MPGISAAAEEEVFYPLKKGILRCFPAKAAREEAGEGRTVILQGLTAWLTREEAVAAEVASPLSTRIVRSPAATEVRAS